MSQNDHTGEPSELLSNLRIMIDDADLEESKQTEDTPTADQVDTSDDAHVPMHTRPITLQPKSPLLRLPTELRLQICTYMTLSPATLDWNGPFFSCRQLHKDMINQLSSADDMEASLDLLAATLPKPFPSRHTHLQYIRPPSVRLSGGDPHPLFSWIRSITIHVPTSLNCKAMISNLYPLRLDNLQILLTDYQPTHRQWRRSPYSDLKTMSPPGLLDGADMTMNCKKVTLTHAKLAQKAGANVEGFSYELTLPGTDVTYLFTIMQDRRRKQFQRSYAFSKRFQLPMVPDTAIEETPGRW